MEQNTDRNSPEAKSKRMIGSLAVWVILLFLVYLLFRLLPALIGFTSNVLYLAVTLLVIAGFFVVIFHPKKRFLLGSLIHSLFRKY